MFYWIYEIPALAVIAIFIVVSVGICWLGILCLRPLLGAVIPADAGLNEILGDFLQYFGVIYGLLLGLLAVATYQNHSDMDKVVTSEASSLAALYRDISSYPEPDRDAL
jgi:hypothetical protein